VEEKGFKPELLRKTCPFSEMPEAHRKKTKNHETID
jgi:hypothetical protein